MLVNDGARRGVNPSKWFTPQYSRFDEPWDASKHINSRFEALGPNHDPGESEVRNRTRKDEAGITIQG